MMKLSTKLAGGILLAALAVAPAVAKPPPAGIWEQYHFRDAKGRIHTVVEPVQIVRADAAAAECAAIASKVSDGFIKFEISRHPELASMTFVSADCATDKSGKIKIAVGAWPAGGK